MTTTADPADGTATAHRTAGPGEHAGDAAPAVAPLDGTGDRHPGGKAVR